MSIHKNADLRRLAARARRDFSVARMADTKWRKLFGALREAVPGIRMRVKFLNVAEPRDFGTPWTVWLHPPRPWIDTAVLGPVELRAIEWLDVPAVVHCPGGSGRSDRETVQDLDTVEACPAALGRFPVERSERGLRVTGYAR
ncbi:DUF6678 family protein [Methylobacterium frigidaeris]|uniref:Uncharacterized protein n=1 Tax=Methylobacterium frigidaeris TaxID=2038277 RepID=A0AA37HF11_9HYPH|nr:DUF6678 family protein [Methylobacterium frigidaeris]PIK72861.1 hypothetical protein CS379_11645 [Methylobacterium frigidaeris]GJD64005.1 hypothetical protein MPEAHAMD_4179 [Methylobacterium frigidaeris]